MKTSTFLASWLVLVTAGVSASADAGAVVGGPTPRRSRAPSALGKGAAAAGKARPRFAPVALLAPSHGERLLLRPFDERGRPRRGARRELSHLMRCPHTAKERAADPRLLPVLYQAGQHFRRPLVISSGYRPPELSTVPRSRHLTASAVDFYVPGVRNEDVVRWLRRSFHPIGVGYYPDGAHVHLDVDRQRDAFWVHRGSDNLPLWKRLARPSQWSRPRPPRS